MSIDGISQCINQFQQQLTSANDALERTLKAVRAGRVSPQLVEGLKVDYYGALTPITQMASINVVDSHTLKVQPWDKTVMEAIEKAIRQSDLGVNPVDKGDHHLLPIPMMTEERRKELSKVVKSHGEDAKIQIRGHRRDAISELKVLEGISEDDIKKAEHNIQTLTDQAVKQISAIVDQKIKDIMTV